MKRNRWKQKILNLMLGVLLILTGSMTVRAEDGAKMVLKFDNSSYEAGSIVTAQIYIYNAEFNTAGFSLQYNTVRMEPVQTDNSSQLITIHNQYDENEGNGIFTVLSREVDKTDGTASAIFYVNPNAGTSTAAGSEGMLVGEISFSMLETGKPDFLQGFLCNRQAVE